MVAQKERVIGTIIYEQRFCAPFALPIEINVVNGILKGNRDLLPHFGGGSLGWGGEALTVTDCTGLNIWPHYQHSVSSGKMFCVFYVITHITQGVKGVVCVLPKPEMV